MSSTGMLGASWQPERSCQVRGTENQPEGLEEGASSLAVRLMKAAQAWCRCHSQGQWPPTQHSWGMSFLFQVQDWGGQRGVRGVPGTEVDQAAGDRKCIPWNEGVHGSMKHCTRFARWGPKCFCWPTFDGISALSIIEWCQKMWKTNYKISCMCTFNMLETYCTLSWYHSK